MYVMVSSYIWLCVCKKRNHLLLALNVVGRDGSRIVAPSTLKPQ